MTNQEALDRLYKTTYNKELNRKDAYEQLNALINLRKNSYRKLRPCNCGCNKQDIWFNGNGRLVKIVCKNCGFEIPGVNEIDARKNWNSLLRSKKQLEKLKESIEEIK